MEWLNFHHLKYFYVMAKAGSLRAAADQLGVSQPSISSQIHLLEDALGAELFVKRGRKLVLTTTGRLVFHYAEEIFDLGGDLLRALKNHDHVQHVPFHVGLTNTVPKSIATELLGQVFSIPERMKLVCQEDDLEDQLQRLASQSLDLVLADEPAPSTFKIRVHNHLLASSPLVLCAHASVAGELKSEPFKAFREKPWFLPSAHASVRRKLDRWFETHEIEPLVIGEFDDPALMLALAKPREVCLPAPAMVFHEIQSQYGLEMLATLEDCTCEYYAITLEKRLKNPAIQAVLKKAIPAQPALGHALKP